MLQTIKQGDLTWRLGLHYLITSGEERSLKEMTFEVIGSSDFLMFKNSNDTDSCSVSQKGTIFSGKSPGNGPKRSAFKSWFLHPLTV